MKTILLPNGMKLVWDDTGNGEYYWDINNDYLYFQYSNFGVCTHTITFSTELF